jgi:hypothetical protein
MHQRITVGQLAAVLHETEYRLLVRVVKVLGPERCVALLAAALLCVHQGGLLVKDGSRRRSLGGVFG